MVKIRGIYALLSMVALCCWTAFVSAQPYAAATWTMGAHATFYCGIDAFGTMGGACCYGNHYTQRYGTNTAALSHALFQNGLSCGRCFALQCITSQTPWCYGDKTLPTATNFCLDGSFGSWCDYPKEHFSLAYPAFTWLAQEAGGVIPVQFMR